MKKLKLLSLAALLSMIVCLAFTTASGQDSTNKPTDTTENAMAPAATGQLAPTGDTATLPAAQVQEVKKNTLANTLIGAGVPIDTNETPAQMQTAFKDALALIPNKHTSLEGWIKFLSALFFLACALLGGYLHYRNTGVIKDLRQQLFKGAGVILLLLTLSLFGSGCKVQVATQQVVNYMQKHCPSSTVTNPTTGHAGVKFQCDSLWNGSAIAAVCPSLILTVDVGKGQLVGVVDCNSAILQNLTPKIKTLPAKK